MDLDVFIWSCFFNVCIVDVVVVIHILLWDVFIGYYAVVTYMCYPRLVFYIILNLHIFALLVKNSWFQVTCGGELAIMFVDTLVKAALPYNEETFGQSSLIVKSYYFFISLTC